MMKRFTTAAVFAAAALLAAPTAASAVAAPVSQVLDAPAGVGVLGDDKGDGGCDPESSKEPCGGDTCDPSSSKEPCGRVFVLGRVG
ncbi:hypothetical protein ABZ805_18210 [Saccharopolyspora sp. NPDC047091]|uniref:hypothetical protein n=1 Tax=Saccharopolyspora sp. NPDC047091 TaxID=3155924 RepID=UPI0033C03B98